MVNFPEAVLTRLPPGTRATITKFCEARGLTTGEFVRQAVLDRLEAAGHPVNPELTRRRIQLDNHAGGAR